MSKFNIRGIVTDGKDKYVVRCLTKNKMLLQNIHTPNYLRVTNILDGYYNSVITRDDIMLAREE